MKTKIWRSFSEWAYKRWVSKKKKKKKREQEEIVCVTALSYDETIPFGHFLSVKWNYVFREYRLFFIHVVITKINRVVTYNIQ